MRERTLKDVEKREERVKRVSINGLRDILTVDMELNPDFHYCWVNDYNVHKYTRSGYSFVEQVKSVGEDTANRASQVGSRVSKAVGNNVTAFLMQIPMEYYLEDQKELQDAVAEREQLMRQANKNSGMYGGVSIERK